MVNPHPLDTKHFGMQVHVRIFLKDVEMNWPDVYLSNSKIVVKKKIGVQKIKGVVTIPIVDNPRIKACKKLKDQLL